MLKDVFTSGRSTQNTNAPQQATDNPYVERVVLPDGAVMVVARGSLAAAKSVVAERKAALRRMEEQGRNGHDIVFLEERASKGRRAS